MSHSGRPDEAKGSAAARRLRKYIALFMMLTAAMGVAGALTVGRALAQEAGNEQAAAKEEAKTPPLTAKWVALSIAAVVGVGTLGASWAVAKVGSAALGAVSENPDLFGRTLIYVGLAEGLAIYGLLIGIMLVGKL